MSYKAKAPGSLMLLGEYAVLYGRPALVCAVDRTITVTLTPRADNRIHIFSSLHGEYVTDLSQLQIEKPFQFVLAVLMANQHQLKHGWDITIYSEMTDQLGLGSSSAVTVATLTALQTALQQELSPQELVKQGVAIVRRVQGVGSGADIAAAVYGGMVSYQAEPLSIEKIPVLHPLVALYAGFKTATVTAIKRVQDHFSSQPVLLQRILDGIGQCALEGIAFARQQDWTQLGNIMNVQQGFMETLGVNTLLLQTMVDYLRQQPGLVGAKISGSGLGDCVIGLGRLQANNEEKPLPAGVSWVPVAMTLQGVQCEKI